MPVAAMPGDFAVGDTSVGFGPNNAIHANPSTAPRSVSTTHQLGKTETLICETVL